MYIRCFLDKPNAVYQPGESITGKVIVGKDSDKTIRG